MHFISISDKQPNHISEFLISVELSRWAIQSAKYSRTAYLKVLRLPQCKGCSDEMSTVSSHSAAVSKPLLWYFNLKVLHKGPNWLYKLCCSLKNCQPVNMFSKAQKSRPKASSYDALLSKKIDSYSELINLFYDLIKIYSKTEQHKIVAVNHFSKLFLSLTSFSIYLESNRKLFCYFICLSCRTLSNQDFNSPLFTQLLFTGYMHLLSGLT